MNELDDEALRLFDDARGFDSPDSDDKARVAAALEVRLAALPGLAETSFPTSVGEASVPNGSSGPSPTFGAPGVLKGVLLSSALVLGVAGVFLATAFDETVVRADSPAQEEPVAARSGQVAEKPNDRAPNTEIASPEVSLGHNQTKMKVRGRGPVISRAAKVELPSTEPPSTETGPAKLRADKPRAQLNVGREVKLVREAQQLLEAGRSREALGLLNQHEEEFPLGVLLAEREAVRVLAHCQLGRTANALASRARFLKRFAETPLRRRVERACSEVAK